MCWCCMVGKTEEALVQGESLAFPRSAGCQRIAETGRELATGSFREDIAAKGISQAEKKAEGANPEVKEENIEGESVDLEGF